MYPDNYTRPADFVALVILGLYILMLHSTYTVKHRNLRLFKLVLFTLFMAAMSNIAYHDVIRGQIGIQGALLYVLRHVYYIALMISYVIFVFYISNLVLRDVKSRERWMINVLIIGGLAVFEILELLSPLTHFGFYIQDGKIYDDPIISPYNFAYIYCTVLAAYLLIRYKRRFVTKMYYCLMGCFAISLTTITVQDLSYETSYTVISYTFPFMAILFLFHYNAYDTATGTLDSKAFDAYIRERRSGKFTMLSLYLQNMSVLQRRGVSEEFFHFAEKFYKSSCTFRLRDDRIVIVYEEAKNKRAEEKFPEVLDAFNQLYDVYSMPYKIVVIHSSDKLSTGDDYTYYNEFLEKKIPFNSIRVAKEQDVNEYLKSQYILGELMDITRRKDLDDPRVKVYCQPVFNTKSGSYTSAEALMRLELPKSGIVFPDQFIPLAEENDCIHMLSLIILNKTCQYVNQLVREGYLLDRISVNFSVMELRDKMFCEDVIDIIRGNDIGYGKIAMELTESQNDNDFDNVKRVMARLRMLGMKFYLDDFGTGYSNFDRIIGLPIDIIKFDRSLTIMAGRDEESRFMVESFSDIFKKSNYQILFEGVEDERDEKFCIEMNALYLQGYKYSKPIPMEQLKNFLKKAV